MTPADHWHANWRGAYSGNSNNDRVRNAIAVAAVLLAANCVALQQQPQQVAELSSITIRRRNTHVTAASLIGTGSSACAHQQHQDILCGSITADMIQQPWKQLTLRFSAAVCWRCSDAVSLDIQDLSDGDNLACVVRMQT
jgi:hypothetical protein